MVGLSAEVLVLSCALIAWRVHRARHRRLEDQFAAAAAAARRMAMHARIADARVAELSELAVEGLLRDLGLDSSTEPG